MALNIFKGNKIRCFEVVPDNIKPSCEQFTNDLKKQRKSMEITDKADCKAVLFYQPIVSRAGTDIEGALQKISNEYEEKYVALVVLHHTFDPECIVPDSKRAVNIQNNEKPEKRLVVDCLFHEDSGLLKCRMNNEAKKEVAKWLREVKHKRNKKQQKDTVSHSVILTHRE
ncbi:uncharacterized protein si:dkey-111e8.5 [Silurus meridionalis]|uniref:uncharacterized protein si:dkey-111e8.5 n=1 Tax=Silurus meridionalis TaxID=175797 RepID=UPI001EE9E132|nr:uncharacterized protein si:dkey-111e8.5 [Silurus meridionalis]